MCSTRCPVVVCPSLCTSDEGQGQLRGTGSGPLRAQVEGLRAQGELPAVWGSGLWAFVSGLGAVSLRSIAWGFGTRTACAQGADDDRGRGAPAAAVAARARARDCECRSARSRHVCARRAGRRLPRRWARVSPRPTSRGAFGATPSYRNAASVLACSSARPFVCVCLRMALNHASHAQQTSVALRATKVPAA